MNNEILTERSLPAYSINIKSNELNVILQFFCFIEERFSRISFYSNQVHFDSLISRMGIRQYRFPSSNLVASFFFNIVFILLNKSNPLLKIFVVFLLIIIKTIHLLFIERNICEYDTKIDQIKIFNRISLDVIFSTSRSKR